MQPAVVLESGDAAPATAVVPAPAGGAQACSIGCTGCVARPTAGAATDPERIDRQRPQQMVLPSERNPVTPCHDNRFTPFPSDRRGDLSVSGKGTNRFMPVSYGRTRIRIHKDLNAPTGIVRGASRPQSWLLTSLNKLSINRSNSDLGEALKDRGHCSATAPYRTPSHLDQGERKTCFARDS